MSEGGKERLVRCFSAVFDQVEVDAIPSLRSEVCEVWDSLASIMLAGVVQQEFGIEISPDEVQTLDSFEKYLGKVDSSVDNS